MKRLALTLLLLVGCVSQSDIDDALDGYCSTDEGRTCAGTADCCSHYACLSSACRRVTAGTCLFADGGTQGSQEPCGCAADCASKQCDASQCK